jgi:hypothetical protein
MDFDMGLQEQQSFKQQKQEEKKTAKLIKSMYES